MKIETSTVKKILITELQDLDPIAAIAEDLGPGRGKITITCFSKSWVAFWPAMGKDSIVEFFTGCDEDYIAGKLSSLSSQKWSEEQEKYVPDPEYVYLCRIIKTVKAALRELSA